MQAESEPQFPEGLSPDAELDEPLNDTEVPDNMLPEVSDEQI
jgi:hypothetical protein